MKSAIDKSKNFWFVKFWYQYSHLVLKERVTWKDFREFWRLVSLYIFTCSFRIFTLAPHLQIQFFEDNAIPTNFTMKMGSNKLESSKFPTIYFKSFFFIKSILSPSESRKQRHVYTNTCCSYTRIKKAKCKF